MKNTISISAALLVAAGLAAACGASGDESGAAPAGTQQPAVGADPAPIASAKAAVADLETAAAEKRVVSLSITGMT